MNHIFNTIHTQPTSSRDLVGLFLGKELGDGMSRRVYEFIQDKSCVVKVEDAGDKFQNVFEWKVWQAVKDTKYAKWFAPCVDISANGIFLIQKRVEMIPKAQYPEEIPPFFTDLKYANFGLFNKRFVCFDYGTIHFLALSQYFDKDKLKFKKAKWWDETGS